LAERERFLVADGVEHLERFAGYETAGSALPTELALLGSSLAGGLLNTLTH
jgi:hypothetical protein